MNPVALALKHQAEDLWSKSLVCEDAAHANNLQQLARMAAAEADSIGRKSKIQPVRKSGTSKNENGK